MAANLDKIWVGIVLKLHELLELVVQKPFLVQLIYELIYPPIDSIHSACANSAPRLDGTLGSSTDPSSGPHRRRAPSAKPDFHYCRFAYASRARQPNLKNVAQKDRHPFAQFIVTKGDFGSSGAPACLSREFSRFVVKLERNFTEYFYDRVQIP